MKKATTLLAGLLALPTLAAAGEPASSLATTAPFMIPRPLNLELDFRARHNWLNDATFGSFGTLDFSPGLLPLSWPKNNDLRARLLTPELRRAPLLGWIATNLYRSRKENGWCLEVDPGDGEYVVLYRIHL